MWHENNKTNHLTVFYDSAKDQNERPRNALVPS